MLTQEKHFIAKPGKYHSDFVVDTYHEYDFVAQMFQTTLKLSLQNDYWRFLLVQVVVA